MSALSPGLLWRGSLEIRGHLHTLSLPAVAFPPFPLPPQVRLDAAHLRPRAQVPPLTHPPIPLQPVDASGRHTRSPKLDAMVRVLRERELVFEVAVGDARLYVGAFGAQLGAALDSSSSSARPGLKRAAAPPAAHPPAHPAAHPAEDAPLLSPLQPPHVSPTGCAAGRRVWEGVVRVRGQSKAMVVACAAVQPVDAAPVDASGWPFLVECDVQSLRERRDVGGGVVRMVAVDEAGRERGETRLVGVVRVLMERGLMFEVRCGGGGTAGWLRLWGGMASGVGLSLMGGFVPDGGDGCLRALV